MNRSTKMRMIDYRDRNDEMEARNRRRYRNGRYAPKSYAEDDMDDDYGEVYGRGSTRMYDHHGGHSGRQKNMSMQGVIGFREQEQREETLPWEVAEEWVTKMDFPEGKPKWSYEQAEKLHQKHKCECDPAELWAVMNALYLDYCEVFRKFGVDSTNLYVELAKAWLEDEDAVEDKALAYYECIVAK